MLLIREGSGLSRTRLGQRGGGSVIEQKSQDISTMTAQLAHKEVNSVVGQHQTIDAWHQTG